MTLSLASMVVQTLATNLLGNGTVIHLPSLFKELEPLNAAGVEWQGRLKLSDRAHLLFDFHKIVDGLLECRLAAASPGGKGIGTTKQGIGPAYASKASRNAVRVGLLRHRSAFQAALRRSISEHQAMYGGFEYDVQGELDRCDELAGRLQGMVVDGVHMVNAAYDAGKRIIAEGANAAMLDVDFGTYPFVTSSSTTAGGVATGLGLAPSKLQAAVGVVKAYTTRVGGGPFPTELTDSRGGGERPDGAPGTDIGLQLQLTGAEIGVTTGRKRRCGWLDTVVLRYSHALNGFTSLDVTKLDVLDELESISIGVAYKLDGMLLPPGAFPAALEDLARVEVVYETMPGWQKSIAGVRTFRELPARAKAYLRRIEELVGVPVVWVGTGAGREDMVTRGIVF